MREFRDNSGKVWQFEMNVRALRRMKARLGYIPGASGSDDVDLLVMLDALYAVCVPNPNDISQDDFEDCLDGCLGEAVDAFNEELTDFFTRQNLSETNGTTTSSSQGTPTSSDTSTNLPAA